VAPSSSTRRSEPLREFQLRVARPTRDLAAAVAFYELLELPVIASFEDHVGYSGVVFGLSDSSGQLELVSHEDDLPSPTAEDQLVFFLGSLEQVKTVATRLRSAGFEPVAAPNPYWQRTGAVRFLDPDGYSLVLSPEEW
jgi:catechol 2,3-dioxygenase-like lactoylglutathione lyase family enzyme